MISDIKAATDLTRKTLLLKKCIQMGKTDHAVIKNFLTKEFRTSKDPQWKNICNKYIQWLDEHEEITPHEFDKDEFLEKLDSSIAVEKKVKLVKAALPHIKKEDEDVFLFMEFHLNVDEPRERILFRKVLDFFQKKGWWNPMAEEALQVGSSVKLDHFLQSPRESKLQWLSEANSHEGSRESLCEWGMNALTFEADLFVISKLVKVLPEVFTATRLYYGRLVDILEIFLKSKDSRVRSNTLEGLGFVMQKKVNVDRIENIFLEMMNDDDGRVKTTAILQLYHHEPEDTFLKIQEIIETTNSRFELDSMRWVLEQAIDLNPKFEKLLQECDDKIQEIALFFPDDDLDWIGE